MKEKKQVNKKNNNEEITLNLKLDKKKLLYVLGGIVFILVIVLGVTLGGSGKNKVKIVKNDAQEVVLEDYATDVFSMKKPKGWTVQAGGEGIYYALYSAQLLFKSFKENKDYISLTKNICKKIKKELFLIKIIYNSKIRNFVFRKIAKKNKISNLIKIYIKNLLLN